VRTQMIREAVARRLFPGVTLSDAEFRATARDRKRRPTAAFRRELLQERRNAALSGWIAAARRSISVDYEPGWEPKT
jgi:hypothetical protein